jgi:G3E family GTPase
MTGRVRFIIVGGFLGAGKTTTIKRLASAYIARGLRVGVVTNDQAENLVDTQTLRAAGLTVEEVPGACFCCAFNDLIAVVERLAAAERPDIILGEPVGSCTDLSATVLQPLKALYGGRCVVAPLVVLVDPQRARRVLTRDPRGGFSPKAAHIFETQLQEADVLAVNKTDMLPSRDHLAGLLAARCPNKPTLYVSARSGGGFDALLATLDQPGVFGRHIADVDYEVYAAGEAEMGWLNATVALAAAAAFDADRLLLDLASRLRAACAEAGAEIGHLKMICMAEGRHGIVNVVQTDSQPELSTAADCRAAQADLVINARVCMDPELLRQTVETGLRHACASQRITARVQTCRQFRPARPVPVHRYARAI